MQHTSLRLLIVLLCVCTYHHFKLNINISKTNYILIYVYFNNITVSICNFTIFILISINVFSMLYLCMCYIWNLLFSNYIKQYVFHVNSLFIFLLTLPKHVNWQKEMHKYFVDAELNSMLGSTSYDNNEYNEVSSSSVIVHISK